jgi:hypothetical protein
MLWRLLNPGRRVDFVSYLMLIVLAAFAPGFVYHRVLVVVLCILGLVYRPLVKLPTFWFALAAVVGMGTYLTWYVADNHKYLMAYVCVALGCVWAVDEPNRERVLAVNSRLLLGLCLLLAAGWKALTPSYRDGSFFHVTLLSDPRFQHVAGILGGIPLPDWQHSRRLQKVLVGEVADGDSGEAEPNPTTSLTLPDSARLRFLAAVMTWWTLGIETTLAWLFLWPAPKKPPVAQASSLVPPCTSEDACATHQASGDTDFRVPARERWRHALLLLFIYSTYALAPVVAFAWLLIVLGLAQCPQPWRGFRAAYLAAFALVPLYALPYQQLLHAWLGG